MKPLDIHPVGEYELLFSWEDGHRSLFRYDYLRRHCPCAGCVDEWTGKRTLKPESVAPDIQAEAFLPVGHYAIKFRWTDHHDTGIYGFEFLRQLCPCENCAASRAERQVSP